MMVINQKDGIFVDKDNILENLAVAHRKGLFSDIIITLSDNVEISTNKFMLACRSPFFATMLFGGLNTEKGDKVRLDCCDSTIMRKVLDYIWYGTVHFGEMNCQSLLNLLETSRMMCLDTLNDGVEGYLKNLFTDKKVEFEDCLDAFDFTISQQFESLSSFILNHIDQNLQEINTIPRFGKLSSASILEILRNEDSKSNIIVLFHAFRNWLENNNDTPENVKSQMISCFKLEQFTRSEIQNIVIKTSFYKDEDIYTVLHVKYNELEETLSSTEKQLQFQKEQLQSQKEQLQSQKEQLRSQKEQLQSQKEQLTKKDQRLASHSKSLDESQREVKRLKIKLEDDPNMCLLKNGGYINPLYGSLTCTFRERELINKVEFTLLPRLTYGDSYYHYKIECSMSENHWTQLVDRKRCEGRQVVFIPKTRMKYLRITNKNDYHYSDWIKKRDGDVIAVLDTTTLDRKNLGQAN